MLNLEVCDLVILTVRSADDGQTTFYTSTSWGHQFQENQAALKDV